MAKIPLKLIGRNLWFCESCLKDHATSDPMKSTPTPHCTECKKHHPIHIDCKGKPIVNFQIDYLQMFYSNPHIKDSIGVA